nr:MAG TPA: hypothetical protein [Bacteriophage sp.]
MPNSVFDFTHFYLLFFCILKQHLDSLEFRFFGFLFTSLNILFTFRLFVYIIPHNNQKVNTFYKDF